jgi:hypothetical protein
MKMCGMGGGAFRTSLDGERGRRRERGFRGCSLVGFRGP